MDQFTLTTTTAALLGVFIEALKKAGLPSRFAPLINVMLASAAAYGLSVFTPGLHDLGWTLTTAVTIAGTAAVGYDTIKGIQE